MRGKGLAFAVLAGLAFLLALYSASVLINVWFLLPRDFSKPEAANISFRIVFSAGAADSSRKMGAQKTADSTLTSTRLMSLAFHPFKQV
jgi:hypothetical protein